MDRILIVSSSSKGKEYFRLLFAPLSVKVTEASSGSEARRLRNTSEFDLIVINSPLTDEFGRELAADLSRLTHAGILLVVKTEFLEEIEKQSQQDGILILAKPVNRSLFYQAVSLALASCRKISSLLDENRRLARKAAEIQLTCRAKCLLVQYLHLTEAEAHRMIEKQAMDLRMSKEEISREIVETYEG